MIKEMSNEEIKLKIEILKQNYNRVGYPERVLSKFWARVNVPENWQEDLNKCWEWLSTKDKDGYGKFSNVFFGNVPFRSHRFSYEIFYDFIIEDNVICHECDNPSCVNPVHLKSSTHQQNINDAVSRNRNVKGSKVGNSKLTEQDIEDIINLKYPSRKSICDTLKISQIEIDYIFNRIVWAHITNKYSDADLINARNFINSCTKLSVNQVKDIRQRLKTGETQLSIANSYNIGKHIVGDIHRGKNYKHI